MSAGQSSGSGAKTEFEDEKVRKDDILSNRDKAQRRPGQSLDGKGIQVDEYKDNPANQRPSVNDQPEPDVATAHEDKTTSSPKRFRDTTDDTDHVDRPGFDLGGSTGDTNAGKGLGLGTDAKAGLKGWRLPK